ncbi:MAG: hypothetical protein J7J11_02125 [Desulfurococcales archaeon]|nr:hypothetical protein [Desulfurococcales archaeon]
MPTHKECINFENGYCRLFNIPVSPDDPACPNFKPKKVMEAQVPPMRSYGNILDSTPPSLPHIPQPRQVRARRRSRHRRGRRLSSLRWWL